MSTGLVPSKGLATSQLPSRTASIWYARHCKRLVVNPTTMALLAEVRAPPEMVRVCLSPSHFQPITRYSIGYTTVVSGRTCTAFIITALTIVYFSEFGLLVLRQGLTGHSAAPYLLSLSERPCKRAVRFTQSLASYSQPYIPAENLPSTK